MDILRLISGEGGRLIVAGGVIGLAASVATAQLLKSLLYEVKPQDPAMYAVATFLLVPVALAATLIPARAAMKVEPTVALRYEYAHIILHDRVAAREPVLFLEPVEDPLRRMPLLDWSLLVVTQNGINDAQPWPQLGTLDRPLALVAGRNRVLQHLPYCLSRKPKLPGYRPLTLALNSNRSPYRSINLHLEHPSGVP